MEQPPMAPLSASGRMPSWLELTWMQRYLDRELTEGELEWFEAYLLDKPELVEMLSADLDLRDGLHLTQIGPEEGVPTEAPVGVAGVPQHASKRSWRSRRPMLRFAATAASILAALGIGYGLHRSPDSVQPSEAIIGNPTRVVFDASRGVDTPPRLDNERTQSDFIVIDVLVPSDASEVALRTAGAPDRLLDISRDGVATLLLRRSELSRMSGLTLRIKSAGKEIDRPLPLERLKESHP